jgi:hypothetical protein
MLKARQNHQTENLLGNRWQMASQTPPVVFGTDTSNYGNSLTFFDNSVHYILRPPIKK